jgi:hypothetical protein
MKFLLPILFSLFFLEANAQETTETVSSFTILELFFGITSVALFIGVIFFGIVYYLESTKVSALNATNKVLTGQLEAKRKDNESLETLCADRADELGRARTEAEKSQMIIKNLQDMLGKATDALKLSSDKQFELFSEIEKCKNDPYYFFTHYITVNGQLATTEMSKDHFNSLFLQVMQSPGVEIEDTETLVDMKKAAKPASSPRRTRSRSSKSK